MRANRACRRDHFGFVEMYVGKGLYTSHKPVVESLPLAIEVVTTMPEEGGSNVLPLIVEHAIAFVIKRHQTTVPT